MTRHLSAEALIRHLPFPLLAIALCAVIAALSSGCMWGFVRGADTHAGVDGATVRVTDKNGAIFETTTNSKGIYKFDLDEGPVPASGPGVVELSAPGYNNRTGPRLIEYDDNPNATLANLSSFWEVINFTLLPSAPQPGQSDLAVTDLFVNAVDRVWAQVINYGPDDLPTGMVDLTCSATLTPMCFIGQPCYPTTVVSLMTPVISLAVGDMISLDTGIDVNSQAYTYDITCTIESLTVSDPDPTNNSFSGSF